MKRKIHLNSSSFCEVGKAYSSFCENNKTKTTDQLMVTKQTGKYGKILEVMDSFFESQNQHVMLLVTIKKVV